MLTAFLTSDQYFSTETPSTATSTSTPARASSATTGLLLVLFPSLTASVFQLP